MSRAGLSCPGCGSSNVVEDDLYCQAQLVCVDCGSVVSEGVLANDPVGGSGTNRDDTEASRQSVLLKHLEVSLRVGSLELLRIFLVLTRDTFITQVLSILKLSIH